MKIRTAALASAAALALLLTGCSSAVEGTAALGGGVVPSAIPSGLPTALPSGLPTAVPSGLPTDLPTAPTGLPTGSTDEPSEPTGEPSEPTEEPSEPTDEPSEPTDEPSEPTDEPSEPTGEPGITNMPTSIPGMSAECNAIYQVFLVFAAPMMGSGAAITQAQVEAAFAGVSDVPVELQDDLEVLKAAAQQMVGKTGTEAIMVLGDPAVSPAIEALSDYMSTTCGVG